MFPRMLDHVE